MFYQSRKQRENEPGLKAMKSHDAIQIAHDGMTRNHDDGAVRSKGSEYKRVRVTTSAKGNLSVIDISLVSSEISQIV